MNLYDYAIKMELDGEQYYRDQAAKNDGQPISRIFILLADAEQKHAALLRNRAQGLAFEQDLADLASEENIFNALDDFRADATSIPRQLDAYRMALDIEKKSIDHYAALLAKANTESDQKLLSFLVDQEKQHYRLFEELVVMVRRPEDWVEDAEFGHREDY